MIAVIFWCIHTVLHSLDRSVNYRIDLKNDPKILLLGARESEIWTFFRTGSKNLGQSSTTPISNTVRQKHLYWVKLPNIDFYRYSTNIDFAKYEHTWQIYVEKYLNRSGCSDSAGLCAESECRFKWDDCL